MYRGYVLHVRSYRENSVLLKLLVDGLGRLDAVTRLGSGKRSLKSILQPFQPLLFEVQGKSELRTLSQVESASPAVPLSGDALYAGMYLNELLVRTLAQQESGDTLFMPYHQTLVSLAQAFNQAPLRYFELELLHVLGVLPSFQHDVNGELLALEQQYRWLPEAGFVAGEGYYSGQLLQALVKRTLVEADWSAAKRLTRELLQPILGDKPLLSRQLFAGRKG